MYTIREIRTEREIKEAPENRPLLDREISWLSFNGRVLQEAQDPTVPLFERLGFLAIYSSNLDDFFCVRVASLRSLLSLGKKSTGALGFSPSALLADIHAVVTAQQELFGKVFRNQILPVLEYHNIFLIDESKATERQGDFLRAYFQQHVRPCLEPVVLSRKDQVPFLKNKELYLVIELWPQQGRGGVIARQPHYALLNVPSSQLPRFVEVPGDEGRRCVIFLDDVIRYNLPALYPAYEVGSAYAVKLTRDAELYLEDEYSGNLVEKIKKSLARRETGLPCRFLYDPRMPHAMVLFLQECFALRDEDLVPGGRYHNFSDFLNFPRFGLDELAYEPLPPLPHPGLEHAPSVLTAVAEKDRMLHFPYQSFDYVIRFLKEAADDPDVDEIWITLYRVAEDSAVTKALIEAARQGKRVTAFVEVKARFDETTNVQWAEQMERAGVNVLYSLPGLKVHAKMALVVRREGKKRRLYAYLSTGNFNEKTARLYADHALFTADPRLTEEVRRIFSYLSGEIRKPAFDHLLVAPFHMRRAFYRLIDREIEHAKAGREARMVLKMNGLEDEKIIARLYKASGAGVDIRLIVRGICCLVPGVKAQSENIEVRSIVDRFLEHARVYLFLGDAEEQYYLSSADWMKRNLSRRVEVAFPIYDEDLRRELHTILALQRADNTKARVIDAQQRNVYARAEGEAPVRAQTDTYSFFKNRLEGAHGYECKSRVEQKSALSGRRGDQPVAPTTGEEPFLPS